MPQFFNPCWSSNLGGGEIHSLDNEEYIKKGNNLLNWKIPKVPKTKIYKRKPFNFFSDPSIKTIEGKVSCGNGSRAFKLIAQNPLMDCLQDRKIFTNFNVGLVQIGVKTLTAKIPSNAKIILCVCDNRHEKLEDSILGMVESSLSDGPLYFNIFPNITMSVFHPKVSDALVMNVIVEGFEQLPVGTQPISVMCRTYYKLQGSAEPDALLESPQGKTVFFQTDFENSNVAVQKVSKWDEVVRKVMYSSAVE